MNKTYFALIIFLTPFWYIATYTFMQGAYGFTAYAVFLIVLCNIIVLLVKVDEQQKLLKEETEERDKYWESKL